MENSKIECIRTECLKIFDWSIVIKAISDINKFAKNNHDNLDQGVEKWTYELLNQITELNTTVKKFQKNIYKLTTDPEFNKNQSKFQKRLKDSAEYFQPKIDLLKDKVLNHPITCKTKKIAEQFDEPLEEVGSFIHDINNQLNYLSKGTFTLNTYLREWKVNKRPKLKIKKTYVKKKTKPKSLISVEKIEHLDLYQQIALYRKEKSEQKNIPIYRIFSNKALKEMCEFLPKTEDSLLLINGLGPKKTEIYGEDLITIIVDYCDKNNILPKSLESFVTTLLISFVFY